MAIDHSMENGQKTRHGVNTKSRIREVIRDLSAKNIISAWVDSPSYGHEGYKENQFDADFELTNADGKVFLLFVTSSFRTDRLETKQWRAINIKTIKPAISAAYLIVPDKSAFDKGDKAVQEIRDESVYSAIDDVLTVQELHNKLVASKASTIGAGRSHDFQGREFEHLFADIMSDPSNLKQYNGDGEACGLLYDIFLKVSEKVDLGHDDIWKIDATTDIPKLPSGGNPKTDVAVTVHSHAREDRLITFSLKNTKANAVSVHEYDADTFADVLDPGNGQLRTYLNAFQRAGNKRDMGQYAADGLYITLQPYLWKLNEWVFSGKGPSGIKPIQIAQFIVIADKDSERINIYPIAEYIEKQMCEHSRDSQFGTVFCWTYPSKKRGKKIQLKAKIEW